MEKNDKQELSYQEWREQELGSAYMVWHDGVSPTHFAGAKGGERDYVIRMLLRGLDEGDDVAAILLGGMEVELAAREFRKRLPESSGRLKVEMARWLAKNEKDGATNEEYAEAIAGVATEPSSAAWGALIAMRDVDTPATRTFLLRAVAEHPNSLARYHAAESFLHIIDATPKTIADHKEIFGHLVAGVREKEPSDADREEWQRAADGLRALTEKK